MKESYWKRGSKEDAERIREAFRDLGACTCADYTQEDILYVLDGICGTLFMLPYESQTAEVIMDSHMFNELKLPIEPKFKVGNWIACDADSFTLSIKSVRDVNYYFHQGASLPIKDIDEHYHLWTIADAKDGDVLVDEYTDTIGIFEETNGIYWNSKIYCAKSISTKVYHHGGSHHIKFAKPATKEQRDLLFAKIKEAGYEWDADKKELRKIIKPKFKLGDRIQSGTRIVYTINQVDCEKQQYIVGNKDVLRMTIPFREQSKYEVVNIPEPKFEVDDLVVLDDLLGRITQSKYEDGMWLYRVGCRNTWNFDYELMKADFRDEHRILKGGGE